MTRKSIYVLLVVGLLLLFTSMSVWAHCIWAEPPMYVELGQEVTLPIYYADPDDPIEERDMTDLSLYVIRPGGELLELDLVTHETYEEGTILFDEKGQYQWIVERVPSRYRLQEIRDFGVSRSYVEAEPTYPLQPLGIPLEILPIKKTLLGDEAFELTLQVLYEGEPLPEAEIEIFQSLEPDGDLYDEIDEVEVDGEGMVTLRLHRGKQYVFETDNRVPASEVEGTGTFITQVRFRSTLYLGIF